MARNKIMSAEAAARLIPDGATVGTTGGGGGLLEADTLMGAVETRFLTTRSPRNLTIVHPLGLGDRDYRGLNHFAHEGLVKRVIGGHWVWSPRMQQLARDEKIEAYVLPGGVIMQLWREIAAKRPGLHTHVGLGTFVDPRQDGGKMNRRATEDVVELVRADGRDLLRYKPFQVDVAILRGSVADPDGNISFDQEGATLDGLALAMAAHNCGGKVLVQVRRVVDHGELPPRSVRIPGALVDAVVVEPNQPLSHEVFDDPSLTGEARGPDVPAAAPAFNARIAIARRAAEELHDDAVINYGFGIPDAVAKIVAQRGDSSRYYQTIEHGTYGGTLLDGTSFGYARNPAAMIDAPSQFDFYNGGGLDIAFLGMGELDRFGHVNVSKLGGVTVGPGGFIDIAQNARKVVFCGTFEAKGVVLSTGDGRLTIRHHGEVRKLVHQVDQITFSGTQANLQGQEVVYITERAVFRLTPEGLVLSEVAPGIDVKADILDRMAFTPLAVDNARVMDSRHFRDIDRKG
ncbi:MAG: acyl CoA:acetate/3-ketoacid CoA transferase [Alphaproteobacteria bacterium]|nr:acyl CoA:acetate/3-ketoacid CoA transferase [Alphaproteobacteria bacterium]